MKQQHSLPTQRGMTLIEILIAMVLGVFLLGGVIGIFINSKQTYRMQEALSRLQENSRFAVDFMSRDIRETDFWGCTRQDLNPPNNILNIGGSGFHAAVHSFTQGVLGVNDADSAETVVIDSNNDGDVTNDADADVIDGTDILSLSGATSEGVFITTVSADDTVPLTSTLHGFTTNNFLFVTDCFNSDIFQPSAVTANTISHATSGSPGNTASILSTSYGKEAQIYTVSTIVYSIQNGVSGLPSLYRTTNGDNQELIEGVEDMQILYGEDTDNDGVVNYYVPAGTTGLNMSQVISVRISLLAQTIDDNIASRTGINYTFNGATTAAPDKRLRQVSTFTVAIRSRLI